MSEQREGVNEHYEKIVSAEAAVLHAALEGDVDEIDKRLAAFYASELRSLDTACERVLERIARARARGRYQP